MAEAPARTLTVQLTYGYRTERGVPLLLPTREVIDRLVDDLGEAGWREAAPAVTVSRRAFIRALDIGAEEHLAVEVLGAAGRAWRFDRNQPGGDRAGDGFPEDTTPGTRVTVWPQRRQRPAAG